MQNIFMVLTSLGMFCILFSFIYSTLKNKQHKLLCNDFYSKYGYYPDDIRSYENGGILFTFQKDIHFFLALSFNKKSFFVRNINNDLYLFIREQPKEKTSWIKIKFFTLLFGFIVLVLDYAIFISFIK